MTASLLPRRFLVPFQKPEPPSAQLIMSYYILSEREGRFANDGPCLRMLSERLADDTTAKGCVPAANGTIALMAALRALVGTASGRRCFVVVPSFTCPAVACAVTWSGFQPLFVDIAERSWHLDPDRLEEALEAKNNTIAAVIAPTTFGTPPPSTMRVRWRQACATYGIPLIVDAAAGLGSLDRQRGEDVEVYSFYATKPSAVGEGAAIALPNATLVDELRRILGYGRANPLADMGAVALNGRMSELHAAAALAMLDQLAGTVARRRQGAERLQAALSNFPLEYQAHAADGTWPAAHVMMSDEQARTEAVSAAAVYGVEVRTLWDPPLHRQPAFCDFPRGTELPVTERVASKSLSLPMSTRLTANEIKLIQQMIGSIPSAQ